MRARSLCNAAYTKTDPSIDHAGAITAINSKSTSFLVLKIWCTSLGRIRTASPMTLIMNIDGRGFASKIASYTFLEGKSSIINDHLGLSSQDVV